MEHIKYYNNQLCIQARWMIDNGVMTKSQYRNGTQRNQFVVERAGCRGTLALVAYESMPERFKKGVRELIGGNPYDTVKVSQIEQWIEHMAEITDFFEEKYKLSDGRRIPKETRLEYYTNAIILEGVHRMILDKTMKKRGKGGRVKVNWEQISEGIQDFDRTKYPHSLPANPRRLNDRYKRYRKEGPVSLVHKNFTNVNAARVEDDVQISYLTELLAAPNNLDNAQVARLYNIIADQMNWKSITSSTVANWRDKLNLTVFAGTQGSTGFSNKKAMQVKRSAPTEPLLYLTLDGWDAELMYQKADNGTTSYHHRPTIVVALDPCLKYPLGYAIGTHETPELIKAALRNAANHTAELFGRMYRVHQLQSDRYAIKKMTPVYEAIAKMVTPARAKNAKAKAIEPYFNNLNKKWCQMLPNWSGFGITTNRERQPNTEYLNKYKKSFPDFEGVCQQLDMIMARERDEKIEEYMKLWDGMDSSRKIELSDESYLLQFGETTGRTILLQGSGLHPTILGQKRTYDCFDISFRDHSSTKWTVLYDPDNLEKVLAVNEDESLRFMMEEKYVQPMALADRKEGDSEQLKRINQYNDGLFEEVTERRALSGSIVRNHMEQTNAIQDSTLKRLLITDSNGQHKNVKSLARTGRELPKVVDAVLIEDENEGSSIFDRY